MIKVKVLKEVKEGKLVFTGLSENGDDRLVWDAGDPRQIKDAIRKFDEYVSKGFLAFLVNDDGSQGEMINEDSWQRMDVRQREEILFKPQEITFVPRMVGG